MGERGLTTTKRMRRGEIFDPTPNKGARNQSGGKNKTTIMKVKRKQCKKRKNLPRKKNGGADGIRGGTTPC